MTPTITPTAISTVLPLAGSSVMTATGQLAEQLPGVFAIGGSYSSMPIVLAGFLALVLVGLFVKVLSGGWHE